MWLSGILVILFLIDVNSAAIPDSSLRSISQALEEKSHNPFIVVLRSDPHDREHDLQAMYDDDDDLFFFNPHVRFVKNSNSNFAPKQMERSNSPQIGREHGVSQHRKVERALGKFLKMTKNNAALKKLRSHFSLLREKIRQSLRNRCGPGEACEEIEESEACSGGTECFDRRPPPRPSFTQKSNREVYAYLKRNPKASHGRAGQDRRPQEDE